MILELTNKFDSLKNDIQNCTFDEFYTYINELIGNINIKADALILADGGYLYWYNNARYDLIKNTLYKNENQKIIPTKINM